MAREYSIAVIALLAATAALAADPCPAELAAVTRAIAAMRAVPAPFAPPCRVVPSARLAEELDSKLRRDLPLPPEVFLEALVRTGMVEGEPAALYRRLLDFYGSQVLGFYEPGADEMVLITGGPAVALSRRMVWAHELAHAAQEKRFRLPSRLLAMRSNGDQQRAASTIAEGDAMLAMMLLDAPPEGADAMLGPAVEALAAQATAFPAPAGIPDYFVQELLFPYTAGFATVAERYRSSGWSGVDALLARPPTSTAALLYPHLGEPGPAVGGDALPPVQPGWSEVLTDTLGAWGLRFWLGRRVAAAEADALAAHWDGDRLRLIRSTAAPECWALAWRLRCRDEAGRAAQEAALQRHLPSLLGHLCPAAGPVSLTWSAAGRTLDLRAGWPMKEGGRR
jgi:hypothetical protein